MSTLIFILFHLFYFTNINNGDRCTYVDWNGLVLPANDCVIKTTTSFDYDYSVEFICNKWGSITQNSYSTGDCSGSIYYSVNLTKPDTIDDFNCDGTSSACNTITWYSTCGTDSYSYDAEIILIENMCSTTSGIEITCTDNGEGDIRQYTNQNCSGSYEDIDSTISTSVCDVTWSCESENNDGINLSKAVIIALIVIVGIIFIAAIVAILIYAYRRNKRQTELELDRNINYVQVDDDGGISANNNNTDNQYKPAELIDETAAVTDNTQIISSTIPSPNIDNGVFEQQNQVNNDIASAEQQTQDTNVFHPPNIQLQ